ncbi:hypothetical protein [Streptomyces sp. SLBN-31]|nr:hypothetical protein [Streptomyces sp. SLBN-31]
MTSSRAASRSRPGGIRLTAPTRSSISCGDRSAPSLTCVGDPLGLLRDVM